MVLFKTIDKNIPVLVMITKNNSMLKEDSAILKTKNIKHPEIEMIVDIDMMRKIKAIKSSTLLLSKPV